MRRSFRKRFKCQVINFYGASESIAIGVETNQSGGMYLFDDMNYVEIKSDGQYPFTKIKNILGRSEDVILYLEDGKVCGELKLEMYAESEERSHRLNQWLQEQRW